MQWSRLEVTVYGPDEQRVFHLVGTAGGETAVEAAPEAAASAGAVEAAPDSPLARAFAALRANRERPYYDEAADAAARDAYYADVPPDADGATRYRALSALLKRTHLPVLSYDDARKKHLYAWVDLQENGMLRSIYTGDEYPPEKIIQEDIELEAERMERLRGWMVASAASALTFSDVEAQLAAMEGEKPYNCEHVVPQKWFKPRSVPMKSDLHHLFTCEEKCNNFRGNIPFGRTGVQGERCGRTEGNEFEPANGKGAAARATLYFFLRYPGEINDSPTEYTASDIATLLQWHRDEPVSRFELHRNAAVQEAQGNRNPLIDHPGWADRIDFTLGLG